MKKSVRISAGEVVPGKVYLAAYHDEKLSFRPAVVACTDEPGWLRGFVKIRQSTSYTNRITGYATVHFVEDKSAVEIPVHRGLNEGDEWVFATGPDKYHGPTLLELPERWFEERLHEIQQQINSHQRAIGKLEDASSALQLLQLQCSQHA